MTRSVISEQLRIIRLKQGIELLRTGHTLTDVRRLVDDETADYWWSRMRAVPISSTDPGWTEWCKARRASLDTADRSLTRPGGTPVTEPETRQAYWLRRSAELSKLTRAALCDAYRQMGGLGGIHPPEQWYKEELINSIVEMEWDRLPSGRRLPDPQHVEDADIIDTPQPIEPCPTCGGSPDVHTTRSGQCALSDLDSSKEGA